MAQLGALLAPAAVAATWAIRFRLDSRGVWHNLYWVTVFLAWRWRASMFSFFKNLYHVLFRLGAGSAVLLITIGISIWTYNSFRQTHLILQPSKLDLARLERERTTRAEASSSSNPLKPLVYPCQTSHTRVFPKEHAFSYSYLMVGIPVGWRGSVGTFLSADINSLPWKGRTPLAAWFSVESADHLGRGDHVHGLQGKLDSYLTSIVCSYRSFELHHNTKPWAG